MTAHINTMNGLCKPFRTQKIIYVTRSVAMRRETCAHTPAILYNLNLSLHSKASSVDDMWLHVPVCSNKSWPIDTVDVLHEFTQHAPINRGGFGFGIGAGIEVARTNKNFPQPPSRHNNPQSPVFPEG